MRQFNLFLIGAAMFYLGCLIAYKKDGDGWNTASVAALFFGLGLMVYAPHL